MKYEWAGMRWVCWIFIFVVLCGISVATIPARAQNFYQGKEIKIIVGSDAGGGYDVSARLLARYWKNHIPGNPNIVVQDMPGASGLKAMNYVASVSSKDGLTVGAVQMSIGYEPMMGISGSRENAHFDPLKVNWLGSMGKEVGVTVFWNPPPVHSFEELTQKEVTVGSSGLAGSNSAYARLMNSMFGTKFNVVHGYPNQAPIWLAMERGEIQGSAGPFYSSLQNSKPDWLRDHKVTLIVQLALEKHSDLPDVPLITEFAKTPEDRQEMNLAFSGLLMGRPYVLAEGVRADRVNMLRASFMNTVKDSALLEEAQKLRLDINPIDGDAVYKLLVGMYTTPQPIIDKLTAIFVPKEK